tara:strand:- start:791 stop:1495 length:705 start_codon:yes stop_codon:yes gene_type:complete
MSEIRVNKIVNEAGTGSVEFAEGVTLPSGKTISGSGTISMDVTGSISGNAGGLTGTPNIVVGSVTGTTGTFSGNVSIGGTLTYEDVTNIDSVGLVTARSGLRVLSGLSILSGGLVEKFENAGTTLGSQTNNPIADGNVILFTGNESGNNTINFTGIHANISSGENVSFTVVLTPNNSGVINAVQVDGVAQTIQWSGGSAPSAGSSGRDVYAFNILKTGSGTTDYVVLGAATNFA